MLLERKAPHQRPNPPGNGLAWINPITTESKGFGEERTTRRASTKTKPLMKIDRIKIRNIGIIGNADIEINRPLLIFYGQPMEGKSTILSCVKWVCGGAFPVDIIKHGEKEASIELGFDGGCVTRSWYRSKAAEGKPSEVKARSVQFVKAGKPVPNPASELKKLLNPFVLDQDFLRNKSELERKQYFTEQFAVDTSALDTEAFNAGKAASDLRAKLTGYGEIDLTPVEEVNTADLRSLLAERRQAHQNELNEWGRKRSEAVTAHERAMGIISAENLAIRTKNQALDRAIQTENEWKSKIERLKKELSEAEIGLKENQEWQKANPRIQEKVLPNPPELAAPPATPDTSDLESKLQNAAAQNVKAEQYKKNLEREKQRQEDETKLRSLEARQRQIKQEKTAKLAGVSETCGIAGLSFDEEGNFCFEGTQAGMLSTSQIMRLSSLISATYPQGLSIELLDRGESLGRSIFDYVKHAEAKSISVLATVVGTRPADVPEKVGVFCVKDGVIFKDEETV